jgi:hypothetical protein
MIAIMDSTDVADLFGFLARGRENALNKNPTVTSATSNEAASSWRPSRPKTVRGNQISSMHY